MPSQKKRPTNAEVKGMLFEGNFGNQGNEPLPLTDPITVTELVLNLSQIKPYDRNPRKERNPEYDDIKASIIKTKGLSTEISVTRRPGDDLYMVNSGGNTRLLILNELYKKTGDEVFNKLTCFFKPWVSELHILTAHLIENNLRGEMLLIDKAYAIREMKKELEVEHRAELSRNEFSKLAADNGFRISKSLITRFNYAIELDQMIPQLLRNGLGGGKIDQIKKLHQTYKNYCRDKTDQLEVMFMDVMSQHDDEEFDLKEVRGDLDDKLADIIGVKNNIIYLEIQSIMLKTPVEHEVESVTALNQGIENETKQISKVNHQQTQSQVTSNADCSQSSNISQSQAPSLTENIALADDTENPLQSNQKLSKSSSLNTPKIFPDNTSSLADNETLDLTSLRNRSYELACKIAKPYRLDKIIFSAENGLGFIVEYLDYPFDISSPDATVELKRQYPMWWLLFSLSEQNTGTISHFTPWMHTELFHICQESEKNKVDLLTERINNSPEITLFFSVFIQSKDFISDKTFTECFRLMENIRKTKANYPDEEIWVQNS